MVKADTTLKAAVGERLRLTRQIVGILEGRELDQKEFCRRAGIEATLYNKYERGMVLPSVPMAIRLCETYDLTLDWIFLDDPSNLPYAIQDRLPPARQRPARRRR
ncbi:MAG TPA: helix-turn-helix transcriptional regulator [Hyphomicrobiaceae bacterium]|nr:helix-turn-helix transcriptional regulator [Hyphomicrobiaceae bacterium]